MSKIELQELCKIVTRHYPWGINFYLKDSIIYWVHKTICHRLDIVTGEQLEPIDLHVCGDIVSVGNNDVELIVTSGTSVTMYLISLSPVSIISKKTQYVYPTCRIKNSMGMVHVIQHGYGCPRTIEYIPLSRYAKYHEIEVPGGYKFLEAFMNEDDSTTLWSKDGTYHLMGPQGMKDTEILKRDISSQRFFFFEGIIITISLLGLDINGKVVDRSCWASGSMQEKGHILNLSSMTLYRIKDLNQIKVKSCTKRT